MVSNLMGERVTSPTEIKTLMDKIQRQNLNHHVLRARKQSQAICGRKIFAK